MSEITESQWRQVASRVGIPSPSEKIIQQLQYHYEGEFAAFEKW